MIDFFGEVLSAAVFLNCVKVRCLVALRYVSAARIVENARRVRCISLEPIVPVSGMGYREPTGISAMEIVVYVEIDPSCQGLRRIEALETTVGALSVAK